MTSDAKHIERRRRSPDKPAKAIRWTSTAVLVSIQIVPDDPLATRYVWLAADDVKRKITAQRQDEAQSDSAGDEGYSPPSAPASD